MAIFETMQPFWDFTDEKNSIQQVSIVEMPPSAIRFATLQSVFFFLLQPNYPLYSHQAEHTIQIEQK